MGQAPVDNSIYEAYGDRWYTASDDPVALLRAESRAILPWVAGRIPGGATVLDVGCGAGFLSNALAARGFRVTGVDISPSSLAVARRFDATGTVKYVEADAYRLPFADASFNVVTAMDFLEHVERPGEVIAEISRVLRPGGRFLFHTFNRNLAAHLVVIKLVEWLVRNTPPRMHVIHLFLKPSEVAGLCAQHGMKVEGFTGIRPAFSSIPLKSLFTGVVPESLRFKLVRSTLISYLGSAVKT